MRHFKDTVQTRSVYSRVSGTCGSVLRSCARLLQQLWRVRCCGTHNNNTRSLTRDHGEERDGGGRWGHRRTQTTPPTILTMPTISIFCRVHGPFAPSSVISRDIRDIIRMKLFRHSGWGIKVTGGCGTAEHIVELVLWLQCIHEDNRTGRSCGGATTRKDTQSVCR